MPELSRGKAFWTRRRALAAEFDLPNHCSNSDLFRIIWDSIEYLLVSDLATFFHQVIFRAKKYSLLAGLSTGFEEGIGSGERIRCETFNSFLPNRKRKNNPLRIIERRTSVKIQR